MYKLLHVHSNIVFIDHSRRFINDQLDNEILFIGADTEANVIKLNHYGIRHTIFDSPSDSMRQIVDHANTFDGIIFHCLNKTTIEILFKLDPRVKTFQKFFGQELYMLKAKNFLSEKTWALEPKPAKTLITRLKSPLSKLKRKAKIFLNREYDLREDNQRKVYERFDAVLMISKEEYDDLNQMFYLPKLIERQLVDQEQELKHCKAHADKKNKILFGNSGHRWNNHLDVLEILKTTNSRHNISYNLFFSYGTDSAYAHKVRSEALNIKNVHLIETFMPKEEFEKTYADAAALIINSYRQHAIGNIFAAVQNGCKIYLNKKSSTYHWLISKGFLINEISELKKDIESGNIKLTIEQQHHNFDSFKNAVEAYTVRDYVNKVIDVIKN